MPKGIFFDSTTKTFRLYGGNSLYAFCIGPELNIEHLYWGASLEDDCDLRYLCQSLRAAQFTTTEYSGFQPNPHFEVPAGIDGCSNAGRMKRSTSLVRPPANCVLSAITQCLRGGGSPNLPDGHRFYIPPFTYRDLLHLQKRSLYRHTCGHFGSHSGGCTRMDSCRPCIRHMGQSYCAMQHNRLENLSWRVGAVLQRQGERLRYSQVEHIEEVVKGVTSCPACTSEFLEADDPTRNTNFAPHGAGEVPMLMHVHVQEGQPESHAALAALDLPVSEPATLAPAANERIDQLCSSLESDSNAAGIGIGLLEGDQDAEHAEVADTLDPTEHESSSGQTFERPVNSIGKGNLWMEYSDAGTGDFRPPSFLVVYSNGSSITPLKYKSHRIFPGKEKLQGFLPSIRCRGDHDATSLVITMADQLCGLEVDLHYVCMHDYDAITRHAVFRNVGSCATCHMDFSGIQVLEMAHSMTIDLDTSNTGYFLTKLSGSWARERYVCESRLVQGTHTFDSAKGVSSHEHQPFVALSTCPPQENEGEVLGFVLAYSGNFLAQVHVNEMGGVRVNLGINSANFQWNLYPHEDGFCTPEAILVRSGAGLGGMSRTLHRLFLHCLIPPHPWTESCISSSSSCSSCSGCAAGSECKVATPTVPPGGMVTNKCIPALLVNTWEAKYFQIDHESCLELGRLGASIGMNTLVVDDGWFGSRNSTECSIGDWVVNAIKFPFGLDGLARDLNNMGMKLGIWIEPEMLSLNSDLFRRCPHWALGVKEGFMTIGRDQLVLDLSNPEVREHIFATMSEFLTSNPKIEYIKWDMNRPLTEVFSQGCFERGRQCRSRNNSDQSAPSCSSVDISGSSEAVDSVECRKVSQSETLHRCVLGLYELQTRILEAFPYILLENCASGGGRFDPGMLYFSPQIWCSDNTDAIARIKIQYGTSMLYPARCIGAHISAVPNHITGNTTRLRTRGLLAMCGTFGVEMDLSSCSTETLLQLREQITLFKQIWWVVHQGDLYRLWSPFESARAAWMYVSPDKHTAVVFAFSVNSDHWSNIVPLLKLQGLLPHVEYVVSEPLPNDLSQSTGYVRQLETGSNVYQLSSPTVGLSGAVLMQAGLTIKFFSLDDSVMFLLTSKDASSTTSQL